MSNKLIGVKRRSGPNQVLDLLFFLVIQRDYVSLSYSKSTEMKKKKFVYLSFLYIAILLVACSNDPKDDPNHIPSDQTEISITNLPDSVKVESSAEVKFTVTQKGHDEKFSVKVDTVMASYFQYVTLSFGSIEGIPDGGYFWEGENKHYGKADITINGKNLADVTSLANGEENTIVFSNPTAVGEYKVILNVTDKYNRTTRKEIKLNVWSPEIVVKFYTKNTGFDQDQYFDMLNKKFTYNPLSEELKGLECDTIYTQESPTNYPVPGSWTVPGQGIVCYIGQEGDNEIQSIQASSSFLIEKGKILSSTTWASQLDGKGGDFEPRKGFHGVMFETSTLTRVGTQYYTIRVIDKWGKEKMATIVYKAFGRNETIPEHCTPSNEINFWWSHRIPD